MTEPPTALTVWTPDQPLRADATEADIKSRAAVVRFEDMDYRSVALRVAREFADACVEAERQARISNGMLCVRCGIALKESALPEPPKES